MKKIDLHTHSSCSDGSFSPRELVDLAAQNGLSAIALTDHDCVNGIREAMGRGEEIGLEVVSGVEFSLFHQDTAIHLLAYGFDPDHPAINEMISRVQKIRNDRNEAILNRFKKLGIDFDRRELLASAGGQLGRPHFAAYLVRHHKAKNTQDAFNRYLKRGGPAYVPRERFEAAEAMEAIIKAGGIPVLAHPMVVSRSIKTMTGIITTMKDDGLGGIEVIYPAHDTTSIRELTELAARLDLVMTGGSDFHGKSKPNIPLGGDKLMPPVPISMLEKLKKRLPRP